MGSSKKQTVGYWYHPAIHMVLGKGPIDAVLKIRGGDVDAWSGEATSNATITIDRPNLWGGEEAEGGIQGDVDLMFGAPDQMPNPAISSLIGPDSSAHRGHAALLFKGGRYGAMNPYPKPLSVMVRRILKGWDGDTCWYPETAAVPVGGRALTFAETFSTGLAEYAEVQGSKSAFSVSANQIRMLPTTASRSIIARSIPAAQFGALSFRVRVESIGAGNSGIVQVYSADGTYIHGFNAGWPGSGLRPLVGYNSGGGPTASLGSTELPTGKWFRYRAVYDPRLQVLTCTLTDEETDAVWGEVALEGPALPIASLRFWTDGPGRDVTIADVMVEGYLGDAINPAHLLYYSLTAANMQGEPVELINEASFRAAADQLYGEAFGLCTEWDPDKETVEQFRQRICNVIAANCTRSTVDGQWYVDLVRGNYVLEDLPILTDDDILDFEAEPTVMDDAVNQVAVKWFDPSTKQARTTAPLHALGAVEASGVNAETIDYSAIPTESLALRVAERDLRSKSTPLWRYTLTTNRRPYNWRLGTYFRLQAPKRGIADSVCLVGDIGKGTLRSGAISLVATQDVFAMPAATYVIGEPPVPPPDRTPVPVTEQAAFEAPYVELARTLPAAELAALAEEAGYLLTVGGRPAAGTNYRLATRPAGGEYELQDLFDWCPWATLAAPIGRMDVSATLVEGQLLDRVSVGSAVLLGTEIGRVDALDAGALTLSLGRGCGDTVEATHPAGTRLWFFDNWSGTDLVEYVTAEEANAKLLTRTGTAELPLADASELAVTFDQRAFRPYPPAALELNGLPEPAYLTGLVTATWRHRDRLSQADQLIDQTVGSIGPEAGTTYTARWYLDDVLEATQSGISDTTTNFTPSGDGSVRVEVEATRDGISSWQAQVRTFAYTVTPAEPWELQSGGVLQQQDNTTIYLMG
ncbi:phage tail protein [Marilutibacter aestuarii]|uniref:Uncharacterized protein n=1 Tax=Marilutibacter aestuarii TaxID=1706195 RepID=A0A508AMT9_9GAMM|nr:phage tail protein [Lysobacter aestuarii]TQD51246.1 hypothetical protein FKV25_02100 [Lysobacter aestuarii]